MELPCYRVNRNFLTFVCWDDETEIVDLSEYCEGLDDLIAKINNGTLTDEDKDDLIDDIRCSLECGTQLIGKILDDCGQEINTEQDIYRVMGLTEEEVLRENWEIQSENDGIPFDASMSNEVKPEHFWLGRCGAYLFVGFGSSC